MTSFAPRISTATHPSQYFTFVLAKDPTGKTIPSFKTNVDNLFLIIQTPAFLTKWPKLEPFRYKNDPKSRPCVQVDLDTTFYDIARGDEFLAWMQSLDDMLVSFVARNPSIMGRAAMDDTQARLFNKPVFDHKISKTNGAVYPVSGMFSHYGATDEEARVPVFVQRNGAVEPATTEAQYPTEHTESIVQLGIMYAGPKIHQGYFRNSWQLVSCLVLGTKDSQAWAGFAGKSAKDEIQKQVSLFEFQPWTASSSDPASPAL